MRKYILLAIVALLCIGAFFSCSKGNDASKSVTYSMSATTTNLGTITTDTAYFNQPSSDSAVISGLFPSFGIYFYIKGYKGVGTYALTLTGDSYASYASYGSTFGCVSVSGSITITSVSPVTGTFNFVCGSTANVTNGTFTAKTF